MIFAYILISIVLTGFTCVNVETLQQPAFLWVNILLAFAYWLVLYLIHILIVLLMVYTTNLNKPPKFTGLFRFLIKTGLPTLLRIAGVKIKAQGIEKIPDGRVLVVCNHQHDFDPVIIVNAFPNAHLSFIGKKEIFTEKPFACRAMHLLECLYIDRENDREAAKTIIKAIKLLKENKTSIGLFPEGYVSKTGELQPLRNGSLKIALKSQVPVVVCVIDGTKNMAESLFRRRSTVHFRLLDVITPEIYEDMNTNQLGDIIHEKMQTALDDIRNT